MKAVAFLVKFGWVLPRKFSFPPSHRTSRCFLLEQGSHKGACRMGSGANSSASEVILMGILLYFWHHLLLSLITDARKD